MIFKVGIMTDATLIEAPSARAAALFYGINTNGNAQLMAVVYEQDGKDYTGDRTPWFKYQMNPDLKDEFEKEIDKIIPEVRLCKFVSEKKVP